MTFMQSIFVVLCGFLLLFALFHLLRTGKLHEKFSLTWVIICVACVCIPIVYPLLLALANFWGIVDSTSFFFAVAIILLLLLGLQFSYEHSVASRERKKLVIENALLSERLERLENTCRLLQEKRDATDPKKTADSDEG